VASAARILVVEADDGVRLTLCEALAREGFTPAGAATCAEALVTAAEAPPAVAVIDVTHDNVPGAELMAQIRRSSPTTECVVLADAGSQTAADQAAGLGAFHYLLAPCDARQFVLTVQRALERREAASARLEVEEEYRCFFDNLNDIVFLIESDLRVLSVSPAVQGILGYEPEEIVGRRLDELGILAPESLGQAWRDSQRVAVGEPLRLAVYELVARDGTRRVVEVSGDPLVRQTGPTRMVAVARDITERRHLEDQLRQAQKMEAVGRLAGGLAHDFNNLLTAVTGYAEILLGRLGPADRSRKELEQILKAGQRATSLTQQLLAFSRRQRLDPKVLDLNAIVADLEKMLRRLIGEDIDLTVALAPDLGRVEADPGQMGQVLMNLVVNSRDAMPRGGKLTIATANSEVAEAHARVDLASGSYVTLAVGDTGCGMDAETKARIFEPFFTTKGADHGTGLGLSTVYGVVKQTGGHIVAESEVGAGTTFTIYLPRMHASDEEAQEPDVSAEPLQGSETVLLVEDERIVRDLAATMLRNRGYRVVEAISGSHALEVARDHDGPLHLLVTDVVMPGMSGCELADRIASARPGIRLLYMSGYASDATARHGVVDPRAALLRKPFSPHALAAKVREALDQPS